MSRPIPDGYGIALTDDPDTADGRVSVEPMPRERARELVTRLRAAGYLASEAPDQDEPSLAWLYVGPSATEIT